jgi:lipopolysaccharide transport system ATP-binding protein
MEVGKNYSFEISCSGLGEYSDPHVGFRMQDRLGQVLYETNTFCQKTDLKNKKLDRIRFSFKNNLTPGEYTLAMGIESGGHGDGLFDTVISLTERIISFQVIDNPDINKWAGIFNIEPTISVN